MRDRPPRPPPRHRTGAWHLIAAAVLALMLPGCAEADPASSASPAPSPSVPPGTEDTAQTLRDLELTRLRALVDVDMTALEAAHAPDFQLIPPPGLVMTRQEYLAAVATGELDYLAFEPVTPIEVSVHGDAALLTYRSRIHIDAEGQGELEHDTWHTYLYTQTTTGLGWQLEWEQATAVGGFPPP
jgi:ketosteroid isomerase-like protein